MSRPAALENTLPAWVLPVVIGLGLLAIGFGIWRGLTATNTVPGPDLPVRPGMYDLKAELQKRRAK